MIPWAADNALRAYLLGAGWVTETYSDDAADDADLGAAELRAERDLGLRPVERIVCVLPHDLGDEKDVRAVARVVWAVSAMTRAPYLVCARADQRGDPANVFGPPSVQAYRTRWWWSNPPDWWGVEPYPAADPPTLQKRFTLAVRLLELELKTHRDKSPAERAAILTTYLLACAWNCWPAGEPAAGELPTPAA